VAGLYEQTKLKTSPIITGTLHMPLKISYRFCIAKF
jgi:hypothetical protein